LAPTLFAQNDVTAGPPGNRWLFIMQTSRSMQSRSQAAQDIVGSLLLSGMNGQMRRGDTIGVWTFNEKLSAGDLPMQVWIPSLAKTIAAHTVQHLAQVKFEKKPHLEKVLPEMAQLVQGSEFITVILISDGQEKIAGTPFDGQINSFYELWRAGREQAKTPFVTVLQGVGGQIRDFAVNTPPWPLKLPPLPPALQVAPAAAVTPAPKIQTEPPPIVPSLIISGKKTATEESKPPAAPVPATSGVVVGKTQTSAEQNGNQKMTPPLPAKTDSQAAGQAAANVRAQISKPAETAVAKMEIPKPADAAAPATAITLPAVPVELAQAEPEGTFWTRYGKLIGALTLAAAAFGFFFLRLRQSQAAPRASLITRSLDRDKK
jgi:hypothetical protein